MNDEITTGFNPLGVITRKMLIDEGANHAFWLLCRADARLRQALAELPAPPHVARVHAARLRRAA